MSYLSELLDKYKNAPAPDIGLINAGVRDHNESAEAHADVRTKIDTEVAALESAIDDIVNEGASAGTGVTISDAGEYYDGENAEAVLQEVGAQLSAIDTQLTDKVQNFKLINTWVNSNFLNGGIEGWNNIASRLGISVVEGYVTLTANSNGARLEQTTPFNKIYYTLVRMKTVNNGCGIGISASLFASHSGSGLWENISNVRQSFASYPAIIVSTGSTAQIEKACLINLTDTFGAGNEPTKLEMDELMKVIPNGWWDGELSLTQKQFITWQLNLIRKNTNAIIALGGTII